MKEPTTELEIATSAVTTTLPPTPSPHQALVERLKDYGQEGVFALWDQLSPEERDIENLDLPRIDWIIRCSLHSQDFIRVASGGNRTCTGELCVNGRGKNEGRQRKMVEDGIEIHLRRKTGSVAFIWWTGNKTWKF